MCSWRQPANRRGTQQTNALFQPTSFCVNWRNERSLTRLPSLSAFYSSKVLPWHDQKCETTGCKHDTHGPHTQLRMSSLKQTEERSQSLEPRPSGTGSVQKQHHSPSAPNQNIKDMQFVFFVSDTAISICVCELQKNPSSLSKCFPRNRPWLDHRVVLGFRRCWRVKHIFKDLLCVSDVALHAISDLSFNLTKIEDIMKTFVFWGRGKLATNY